jgi:hypothetical protein
MRHAKLAAVAFVASLAFSFSAVAQQKDAGAPKPGKDAGAPTSAAAASTATTAAASPPTTAAGDGGTAVMPSPGTASPSTPSDKPVMDGPTYAVRLRDLEARVDELKDQIRRSHTRLALLSDTILGGGAAGSRSEVQFQNEMSSAFRLTKALFVIDGTVQYNRADDSGALADQKEIPIFSGSIPPGDHTVQVLLNFQGNGYGVFTYLRGYKFEVKSSHSFTAVEGKTLTLTATALEKGGVTTALEQRPAIEWHEKVQALGAGGGAGPVAPGAAPGAGASGSVNTTPSSASGSMSIGGGGEKK